MAVSKIITASHFPLPVQFEKRLPMAYWYFEDSVTGDASGGDQRLTCNIVPSVSPVMVSLEQLSVSFGTTPAVPVLVTYATVLGQQSAYGGMSIYIELDTRASAGLAASRAFRDIRSIITRNTVQGGAASNVLFSAANTNAVGLTCSAWGYLWDVDAINFIGGPVRPGSFLP